MTINDEMVEQRFRYFSKGDDESMFYELIDCEVQPEAKERGPPQMGYLSRLFDPDRVLIGLQWILQRYSTTQSQS